jgi:hypothetical protein
MKTLRGMLAAVAIAIAVSGCDYVTQQEFQTFTSGYESFKDQIKIDGDSVDLWIAAANQWFVFLNDNISAICPDCAPPPLPPTPPPDGDWE